MDWLMFVKINATILNQAMAMTFYPPRTTFIFSWAERNFSLPRREKLLGQGVISSWAAFSC